MTRSAGGAAPRVSFAGLVLPFMALGVVALGLARWVFLKTYLPPSGVEPGAMMLALRTGARFDLKVLSLASLSLLALVCALAAWAPRRWPRRAPAAALALAFALLVLAQICQHHYYGYFRTAFTPMVFGFVEDDTVAVLDLIWKGYPVLPLLALWLGASLLLTWLTLRAHHRLQRRFETAGRRARRIGTGLLVLALLLLARGSLGTFPLRRTDADVSAQPVINDSVRSGVIALHDAWRDRADQLPRVGRADEHLAAYGFDSALSAARLLGLPVTSEAQIEDALFVHTPPNPIAAQHPPHVVMALMESWSGALMQYHDPLHNNLLGRFEVHRAQDLWFTHFYPVHGGTHPTLEGLLLNSPLSPLTQGIYGQHQFATAAARPFKEAGYRTVFVYGGANNWRSVGPVFARQYFDESYSQSHIQKRYPDAQGNLWGVYDEYLMRFVGDLLDEADRQGQKLFVFFLTTTNHPPHVVPPSFHALPLDLARVRGRLVPAPELTPQILGTFQYANDQLGGLLDHIAAAPYGARTIVAATGDHNMRSIFAYELPAQLSDLDAVPLYLRVPPAYLQGTQREATRVGSHADVMPTLYRLALSNARYLGNGQSMLHPVPPEADYGLTMFDTLFAAEGAARPVAGDTHYYAWNAAGTDLAPTNTPPAALRRKVQRARAMMALQDWTIRTDLLRMPAATSPASPAR